jgi:hypothetical protein
VEVDKEEEPRIMMIRVQSLEEREEQRIAEFHERGRQLDEEYKVIFSLLILDTCLSSIVILLFCFKTSL